MTLFCWEGPCPPCLSPRSASTTRLFSPPHKVTFSGHGRIETQTIRVTRFKKTGKTRKETARGVTSLSSPQGSQRELLDFVRGHWEIENRLHWVRDTVFREDTCTTRTGNGAHVMSTLRNMNISLLRVAGSKSIAPVLDAFSNKSSRIFRFLGL